jgi:hypothetical protein
VIGRHHRHVNRPLLAGDEPDLPAQFDAGYRRQFGSGDDGVDGFVGLDAVERVVGIGKTDDDVTSGFEKGCDSRPDGAAWINQNNMHERFSRRTVASRRLNRA